MNKLKYCDFSVICRICLTKCGITFPGDAVILNIFHKLTDLDFQTDDLPQQICLKCFEKINEIHTFSFQCKRSHSALIQCLNQQRIQEPTMKIVDVTSDDISEEVETHVNEDEVEEETIRNPAIFECQEKLKTKELKVNILILEPNVKEVTTKNISVNNDERSYKCGKCSKAFITKSHFIQHERIHKSKYSYKCTYCSKRFKCQSHLVEHERIHTGERPYMCGQCSKTFVRQSALVEHKRIHNGERPYKCSQCSKSFVQHSTRRQHIRIHNGERPYKCGQCSKSFSQLSTLRQHKSIHSGERPYKCGQCLKTFARQSTLVEHKRIHSGERLYKCGQCSKTFARRSTLIKHERVHSGDQYPKTFCNSSNLCRIK